MNDFDLGWLVGLLEGEGCFMWHPAGRLKIQVSMGDRDVVERAAALMALDGAPNAVYAEPPRPGREHHSTMYRTHIRGRRARELGRLLLPHLGERRRERLAELLGRGPTFERLYRATASTKGRS